MPRQKSYRSTTRFHVLAFSRSRLATSRSQESRRRWSIAKPGGKPCRNVHQGPKRKRALQGCAGCLSVFSSVCLVIQLCNCSQLYLLIVVVWATGCDQHLLFWQPVTVLCTAAIQFVILLSWLNKLIACLPGVLLQVIGSRTLRVPFETEPSQPTDLCACMYYNLCFFCFGTCLHCFMQPKHVGLAVTLLIHVLT